mgnify:CR=1 FL=1
MKWVESMKISISDDEYHDRQQRLANYLIETELSGCVLFDNYYILYYTGFAFIPTERPLAFVTNSDGKSGLFVPRLELEHALANSLVDQVESYVEYPHEIHPMVVLVQWLKNFRITGRIGADLDGYPWIFGYQGPKLSELTGMDVVIINGFIEREMMIKSPAEINLIKESVKWSHYAHTLLHRYTRVGVSETEASQLASAEAQRAMLDAIGPIYRAQSPFSQGVHAGYRGQIGRKAAIPHALASDIRFQAGDVLVTGASAPVWGYNSELERTMIMGPANDRQKQMFANMIELQDLAFELLRPGILCAEIDRKLRQYYERNELMTYWKHHVGHAIGLRYHEGPFLDIGDKTEIQPGMVFTVEPGLYVPDLGGFRHSDTVLITKNGIDILTYYPRDLENLTIPI